MGMTSQKLLGGRYQLIRLIGSEEHYKTYLMADTHYPGHPKCTVKHLKLSARNPVTLQFLSRLLKKKVDMLETLGQHERIPKTLAYFEEDQDFYVVQQYVAGPSLEEVLQQRGRLPEEELLPLLGDILETLEFVHARGIIHRSIKPSNIIRRQHDSRWVLIDFGLVKEVNAKIAAANGGTQGTIYTAPEQRQGMPHYGTDVFALGMVALRGATGLPVDHLPHAPMADYEQAVHRCLAAAPDLSNHLQRVIRGMLTANPNQRYKRAHDVLVDLPQMQPLQPEPQAVNGSPHPPSSVKLTTPAPDPQRPSWLLPVTVGAVILSVLGGFWLLRGPQRLTALWWLRQAQQAQSAGQNEQALATYDRLLELYPDHRGALIERSQLYQEQGDTEQALGDLTRALEQSPHQDLYYERGNLRFQVGDLQGAIADYTQALQHDPSLVKAHINRGSARAKWGDEQGAIDDYTAAIDLDPPADEQAAAFLNRCLSQSNLGNQQAALNDCTAAINLRPDDSLAYENRGLVRRRLGDPEAAMKDYTIALEINPDSPEPYYNRGLTRQDLGDTAGALEDFNQALALDPDHVFARYDRGLLAAEQGRLEAATADLEVAASRCLELGRLKCYEDAQFQLNVIESSLDLAAD